MRRMFLPLAIMCLAAAADDGGDGAGAAGPESDDDSDVMVIVHEKHGEAKVSKAEWNSTGEWKTTPSGQWDSKSATARGWKPKAKKPKAK